MTGDNGARLALALSLADEDLAQVEEYFHDRADCGDCSEASEMPNKEMGLLVAVQRVRSLHRRMLEGKSVPHTNVGYDALGER